MPDIGFTHVALPVTNLQTSIAFYQRFTHLQVVHRRSQASNPTREIAWLSDLTRPFVLVLAEEAAVDHPLGPFAHLGFACSSSDEVDRLCALGRVDDCLRDEPRDTGGPAGYLGVLLDPDGHTVELTFGQETGLAVAEATKPGRRDGSTNVRNN